MLLSWPVPGGGAGVVINVVSAAILSCSFLPARREVIVLAGVE